MKIERKNVRGGLAVFCMVVCGGGGMIWGEERELPPALEWMTMSVAGGADASSTRPASLVVELEIQLSPTKGRPIAEPSLVVRTEDQIEGDSGGFFAEAAHGAVTNRNTDYEKLSNLLDVPLGTLTQKDVDDFAISKSDYTSLREGAVRTRDGWAESLRTRGYAAILPAMGEYRVSAARLALSIGWDIHEKRYGEALEKLQTGYGLVRAFSHSDTLMQGFVGEGIARILDRCLLDFVGQEGAPNLYWALRGLPRPMFSMQHFAEGERACLYYSCPELKRLRDEAFHEGDWELFLDRMADSRGIVDWGPTGNHEEVPLSKGREIVARLVEEAVPRAKAFMAEHGKSEKEIEGMSKEELVARYFVRSFDEWNEEQSKWTALPYAEAAAGLKEADAAAEKSPDLAANFLLALPEGMHWEKTYRQLTMPDRDIAMVEVVEGLRMYAGEHGGFPEKLSEVTEVVLPEDPLTGKPFAYERTKEGAELFSADPVQPNSRRSVRLRLRLR